MSRTTFLTALAASLLLRALALPSPGTGDTTIWKVWMFNAAHEPIGTLYGVGGSPPERRILHFAGAEAPVDYPPLALVELGAAGRLYRAWSHRRFPNSDALNAFAKLAPLAADIGFAVLVYASTRSRWATLAYWLNPAVILDASVLGYLDPLFVLPAAGAVMAAASGSAVLAGTLIAAAMLTKAQAIFVAPAVLVALVSGTGPSRTRYVPDMYPSLMRFGTAAVATAAAVTLPVARAGGLPNLTQALSRLATHDMVSANACNLWWIVGYVVRARASMHDLGAWTAFTMPTRILGITRMTELGYPNPRAVGLALTAGASAWAIWTLRRARHVPAAAALAAFLVHAYSTLSAQVHENHLFAAVPFAVLAAADLTAYRPIAIGVSLVAALNLNLFYGFGNGVGYALPRGVTIVDATVVLAVLNCALLCWHAAAIRRVAGSTAGASRPAPAPAFRRAPATRTDSSATRT